MNVEFANRAMNFAILEEKKCPFAPHVLYDGVLDDDIGAQREMGMAAGLEFLDVCAELWIFGLFISEGMKMEIKQVQLFNGRLHGLEPKKIRQFIWHDDRFIEIVPKITEISIEEDADGSHV